MSTKNEARKLILSRRDSCLDIPMREATKELINLLEQARNHLSWMITDIDYRKSGMGIAPHDSDDLKAARELMEKIT